MSETVNSGDDSYPKKIKVVIDGQEREIYDTNNLFGYITTVVKMNDRAAERDLGTEPTISPQKSMVEEVMEHWDVRRYLEEFIQNPSDLSQQVVGLARQSYQLQDALYGSQSEEAAQKWGEWVRDKRDKPEFLVVMSDAFEAIAPALQADGRQPNEITD